VILVLYVAPDKGVSTYSTLDNISNRGFPFIVTVPQGTDVPVGLAVVKDSDPSYPTHYLWTPVAQMTLADYSAALRSIPCSAPVPNMNASAGFPSLDGLSTFAMMSVLALMSFVESLDPILDEDDVAEVFELVARLSHGSYPIATDHPLREILRPYLLRYSQVLSEELDLLPLEEEDARADRAECIQTLRALLSRPLCPP